MKADEKKLAAEAITALREHTEAVQRQTRVQTATELRARQEAAERARAAVPERIGNVSEPERPRQLAMLLSIPGFAQEATRIPSVATDSGAAGVTPEGQVVCTCGGGVTDLELGAMAECVGGCGRYFTGTADKAFSFGPWEDSCDCGALPAAA